MSDGHLFLGDDGVAFVSRVGSVWYDESHSSVLALAPPRQLLEQSLLPRHGPRSAFVRSKSAPALALDAAEEPLSPRENGGPRVLYEFPVESSVAIAPLLLRMSLDRQFLAIQTSDVEVQIVRLATSERYWVVCKAKPGNCILSDGVFWNTHALAPQSSQDLFLVTRLGIEQFRVSPKRRSCALHRTIAVYIHTFWYSAMHSVLIVSTGSRANEIVPFLMQGQTVEKLPRLVFSCAVRKRDMYLASLYDDLYAVYSDAKTTRLLLYRIARDKVSCVRSLHLMLPAGSPIEFSVVDNLLVCHSVEFSVALFFDIKCDANTHDPFSHPLPVSLLPPVSHQRNPTLSKAKSFIVKRNSTEDVLEARGASPNHVPDDSAATSTRPPSFSSQFQHQSSLQMNHQEQHNRENGENVVSPWRFLSPDLAQRSVTSGDPRSALDDRIEIRRFHLNLEHVTRSCAQHIEILPFLLRRSEQQEAKRLALGLVRERLEEQVLAPATIAALLSCVQTVSGQELDRFSARRTGEVGTSDESGNDTSSDDEYRASYGARSVVPLSLRKRLFREGSDDPFSIARIPSRNASGLTMILQSEFFQYLWLPLLEHSAVSSSGSLSACLLEFVRLLHQSSVPVETQTYIALAKSLLFAGKAEELYQVVQYHVLSDSTDLADLLLQYSKQDSSLRQLALDMYTRLGATTTVVQILLDDGKVDEAIAVAWRYLKTGTCDPTLIPGAAFFDACVRSYLTSDGTTTMIVQQRLHSLLLFLRMWDNECLLGNPSALAQSVSVTFPDDKLPESTRPKWRIGFGFPPAADRA